ncbi:stage II sporulation protein M [Methanobrevibacter sp.]|uniref:stage II sporulation protein M n=1 Tax=Methanobrevibacter sp. TaxID=66852 RepID=UPI0038900FD1
MKDFFKRNKKVLLISLIIFLIFAVGAAIFTLATIGDQYGMISANISAMKANGTIQNDTSFMMDTFEIFLHNLVADLIVIVGGLLFSIVSVLIVIYNAVSIGAPFGMDFAFFAPTILPHGIIEYSASVFSLAAAFKITQLEIKMIKNRSFKNTLAEHKRELKDILIMVVIIVILLAIAAVIECNFIDIIVRWAFGI